MKTGTPDTSFGTIPREMSQSMTRKTLIRLACDHHLLFLDNTLPVMRTTDSLGTWTGYCLLLESRTA